MKKPRNKKVGIINHWMVNNYGALFLAYALEKVIERMGFDVESITYLPDEVKKPWKLSMIKKIGFLTYCFRLGYFIIFILPRKKSFASLRAKMNNSAQVYNDKTISNIATKYDKFVIGGDQLWNTKINYYNEVNFLPFIKEPNKKVVYAASIAQETIRPEILNRFTELANDFSYITSREVHTKNLIEKHTGKSAPWVLDPAFLLQREEWIALAKPDLSAPARFIFVYQVQSDVELIEAANKLAKKIKCKVIFCPFPLKKQISCTRKPYISPERWLWYVQNAEYVITDAYHGVVMSLSLNTPFYAQISSYGADTKSRITNLLDTLELSDCLFEGNSCPINVEIDFKRVNEFIAVERECSLSHLSVMLGEEKRSN